MPPPTLEGDLELEQPQFNKNAFTISLEKMGDDLEMFVQKSADSFFNLGNNIKNFFTLKKFKNQNGVKPIQPVLFKRKKTPAEKQYELSKKIYKEHEKLERKLEKIEASLSKTYELTGQIKEDTSKMKVDMEVVVFILESQMERIDDVENYMKENLGSEWLQIKNIWSEYKEGELTRGEFTKAALKKLGKSFLGIFVNTVS